MYLVQIYNKRFNEASETLNQPITTHPWIRWDGSDRALLDSKTSGRKREGNFEAIFPQSIRASY